MIEYISNKTIMSLSMLNKFECVLKSDKQFCDTDGNLIRGKAIDLITKGDPCIVDLLYSDENMRNMFFTGSNHSIFLQQRCLDFCNMCSHLPGSYTTFTNKIGLVSDSRFIDSTCTKVVLNFPYKDCVLECGMENTGEARIEDYHNMTLDADEIDRLFSPKVFTKFEDHGDGLPANIHERNLIIKGDNLLVAHSLLERYRNCVKLVYMDFPYNTGGSNDTFTYNNNFSHSDWLNFAKERLKVAKDLLREDGFAVMTIDHIELGYLIVLADEIFRRENRVGLVTIVIKPEGRQFGKFFSPSTEFMLVYAKNKNKAKFENVIIDDNKKDDYDYKDDVGAYKLNKYINYNKVEMSGRNVKPNNWYPFYVSNDLNDVSLEKKDGYTEVWPIDNNGVEKSWQTTKLLAQERIDSGDIVCQRRNEHKEKKLSDFFEEPNCEKNEKLNIYLKIREEQGQRFVTHWTDSKYNATHYGTNRVTEILGRKLGNNEGVSYPKSIYSVKDPLKMMTSGNDLIVDLFSGSGTTGQATIELNKEDGGNRIFILIEQLKQHMAICKEIVEKVGGKFTYMELFKLNEKYIDRINDAKTSDELLKIYENMKVEAFFKYDIDTSKFDDKKFIELTMFEQKDILMHCLDLNHLYVNFSEIEDETYSVQQTDKDLNHQFYNI